MREIKFRQYDGEYMHQWGFEFDPKFNSTGFRHPFSPAMERYPVMQYTGLNDKNGVEIYESDVYTQGDKNIKYVVIFNDCQFIGQQVGNKSLAGLYYFQDDIEVIGNIHENPELIND